MSTKTDYVIENLRNLRIQKKISVMKLSEDSGVSRSHIFYIETKKISPTLDTLERLCTALGIEVRQLFEPMYNFSSFSQNMAADKDEEPFYKKDN